MGFTDALKRSLGFEEDTSLHNKQQNNYRRPSTPSSDFRMSNNNASDLSSHSYYDDVSISPEQSFYEIMLIRPKTIDDINYVVDQVLEESNPVILDLSFLGWIILGLICCGIGILFLQPYPEATRAEVYLILKQQV